MATAKFLKKISSDMRDNRVPSTTGLLELDSGTQPLAAERNLSKFNTQQNSGHQAVREGYVLSIRQQLFKIRGALDSIG